MKDSTGLKWQNVLRDGLVFGRQLTLDHGRLFFGNRNAQLEDIKSLFSEYDFAHLQQTHGDQVCEVRAPICNGLPFDAHFTAEKGIALLIKTADCLPILAISKSTAVAIHAGWRGVANKITEKALVASHIETPFLTAIGPHIQAKSFEIEESLAKKILQEGAHESEANLRLLKQIADRPGKVFLDLAAIIKSQVKRFSAENFSGVITSDEDTFSDLNYSSFRRDQGSDLRQWSFVVLH